MMRIPMPLAMLILYVICLLVILLMSVSIFLDLQQDVKQDQILRHTTTIIEALNDAELIPEEQYLQILNQ